MTVSQCSEIDARGRSAQKHPPNEREQWARLAWYPRDNGMMGPASDTTRDARYSRDAEVITL